MIPKKFPGLPLTIVLDHAADPRHAFVREKAAPLAIAQIFLFSPTRAI
jgi:hypothetical protein